MLELFEFPLSGNCHKVRLMLSALKLDYKSTLLNGAAKEQKSAEFLALNPFGQVPVLKDGDVIIRDSQAILVYLARAYGDDAWFPAEASQAAAVTAWLSTAANEVVRGPNALRLHYKFGRAINRQEASLITQNLLVLLNEHLAQHNWLATPKMSIADLAVYPYIALAHEGQVDLAPFVHVKNWLSRIELFSWFVPMPGIQLQAH